MFRIRKGDLVQVIRGVDKGKKGKVLEIFPPEQLALVEGINVLKKHKRRTQADQQGGIVSIEKPLGISKLMLLCKNCNRPARVGFTTLKDGTKSRICKKCKEVI
jgi:large subunit ribosomal protein L24